MNRAKTIICMKNLVLSVIVAIAMIACADRNAPVNPNSDKGALPGKFSISATQQVRFSQGNLQYRASKNKWRFAENQYDIVGEDNANISDKYDGWIDLFGYGTGDNPTLCNPDDRFYSNYVAWGDNPVTNGGNKAKQVGNVGTTGFYWSGGTQTEVTAGSM